MFSERSASDGPSFLDTLATRFSKFSAEVTSTAAQLKKQNEFSPLTKLAAFNELEVSPIDMPSDLLLQCADYLNNKYPHLRQLLNTFRSATQSMQTGRRTGNRHRPLNSADTPSPQNVFAGFYLLACLAHTLGDLPTPTVFAKSFGAFVIRHQAQGHIFDVLRCVGLTPAGKTMQRWKQNASSEKNR